MLISKIYKKLKDDGIILFSAAAFHFIFPRRLNRHSKYKPFFENKFGLEIGGPSEIFRKKGLIPIYARAARIDNCTFSHQTIWEGKLKEGNTFYFNSKMKPGVQYITEASDLNAITSGSYDFVMSSHVLEHLANPFLGLKNWIRVLKDEGILVLVVPHKDGTFDHQRPVTSLVHLIQDFEDQIDEGDMTHLDEILELHDLGKDPDAGGFDAFKARSLNNIRNRCLHHHVFDTKLAVEVVNHMGLRILAVELFKPFHIVVVAQKVSSQKPGQNDAYRGLDTLPCWSSPFPSDLSLR